MNFMSLNYFDLRIPLILDPNPIHIRNIGITIRLRVGSRGKGSAGRRDRLQSFLAKAIPQKSASSFEKEFFRFARR